MLETDWERRKLKDKIDTNKSIITKEVQNPISWDKTSVWFSHLKSPDMSRFASSWQGLTRNVGWLNINQKKARDIKEIKQNPIKSIQ